MDVLVEPIHVVWINIWHVLVQVVAKASLHIVGRYSKVRLARVWIELVRNMRHLFVEQITQNRVECHLVFWSLNLSSIVYIRPEIP